MALLVARRAGTVLAAAGTALILASAPALATISSGTSGTTVSVDSDGGDDSIVVGCTAGETTVNGTPAPPPLACSAATMIDISDDGGTDTINLGQVSTASFPALTIVEVDVQDGIADTVTGSAAADFVTGDNQDVVATGGGDDWIDGGKTGDGGSGDDFLKSIQQSVQGGTGDDTIYNPGQGPIDGGPGTDTAVLDASVLLAVQDLNFQITDSAIIAQTLGITLTTPTASLEEWIITTLAGNNDDVANGAAYSGRLVFRTLGGNDTVTGGAGQDLLDGGSGNDVLDAGGAADEVRGGEGNDTLNARDGITDIVDCGGGSDTLTADIRDVVVNCESVSIPPPDTAAIIGPKKITKGDKALYILGQRAQDYAGAGFEARIDKKGPFKPCANPFKLKTKKLKVGKHTLEVRAVLPAGNVDPTPSIIKIKVVAKK